MQSEKLLDLLENLRSTKTKVHISLVSGYAREGYIVAVSENCLCLERNLDSETMDFIIPYGSISSVDIEHNKHKK